MKIGDLVRYAGTRDGEFLGLVTKESRIPQHGNTVEYYVIWVNVDNEGWWNADLLEKVANESR